MTGRERGTLAALLAIALVAAVGFGGMKVFEYIQHEKITTEKKAHNVTAQPGESLVLDGDVDNSLVLSNGDAYTAYFGWTGKMEVSIKDAKLYRNIEEAKKDLGDEHWLYENKGALLVLTVDMRNIDALSFDDDERGWFNISYLGTLQPCEYSYFDGTAEGASPDGREDTFFNLPQGQEATYHVGLLIDDPGSDLSDLWIHAGVNHPYKYRFKLDIEDLRGARS